SYPRPSTCSSRGSSRMRPTSRTGPLTPPQRTGRRREARRTMSDSSAARPEDHSPVNRNVVMGVLLSGAFVIILNPTLLHTALPAFMQDLGITASAAQWVTTIFMLVNGIMIPVTAFLIQKFTTRGLFLTAMGLFIVGTLICAFAPVYPVLLLGRVVQATSGGLIIPLMQTILFAIFPVHKRGAAMG